MCSHTPVDCSHLDGPCVAGICYQGSGSCVRAPDANGLACDDGNACTVGDTCSNGTCVGGSSVDCNGGLSCTIDGCNPTSGYENTIDGGSCLYDGVCYSGGQVNPGNECEECNTSNPTGWTARSSDTVCSTGFCDGAGSCVTP